MIPIRRFTRLAKMADEAAVEGDMDLIAILNSDKDLRSANIQFIVRGKATYVAQLDELLAGREFEGATWTRGDET